MAPILARVKTLWDVWDIRLLVLLSLALQIILSLFGNRRKYVLSPWIHILIWSAYLTADWVATVALGKLSDPQVNYDNGGNALRAIWAPLLLLHLGGPDTITAFSLEDNHLWMRHLFGLVVQFSVAVYVILMSWKHSWFSFMSIPALVAGFIKYGERTWVLLSVSRDKSGKIVPFGNVGGGSNLGNNSTLEDKNSIHVLCFAHSCVKAFKKYTQFYDMGNNEFVVDSDLRDLDDISLLWNAIEVEMGLMFDLLYTKAPINFRKGGCILRCFTFSCTVGVLIGLILRLGEGREKWHKVDIAITEVLLVGALALEIYAIISLYIFSDWAMFWLIKNDKAEQVIQLRKIKSWLFFLPKQYWYCKKMGQVDVLDFWIHTENNTSSVIESEQDVEYSDHQRVGGTGTRRILGSLLGIKRWVEEYFKDMLNKYVPNKTAAIDPSHVFDQVLHCCQRMNIPDPKIFPRNPVEEGPVWETFFNEPWDQQIHCLHLATEICYNLEMEWDSTTSTVSQHTIVQLPSSSSLSSSWEENRELCRTLSRYIMYLVLMHISLLPTFASEDFIRNEIQGWKSFSEAKGERDVRGTACQYLWETDALKGLRKIVDHVKSKHKEERWEMLKLVWVRVLCYAASKGQRNEHLRQLSQGGEFLTFLWFLIPQTLLVKDVRGRP